MKKLFLFYSLLILASCKDKVNLFIAPVQTIDTSLSDSTKIAKEKFVIVPGKQIGNTEIGLDTEKLGSLGKPDFSDAAMGKAWLVWYKNGKEKSTKLMVYTTYKNNEMKEKVVSEIRINSDDFKTKNGIGVGSSFEIIKEAFPEISEFTKYRNQKTGKDVFIYDAPSSGIAFEFISLEGESATCNAVIVYDTSRKINTDYLLLLPERETKEGE